MTRPPHDDVDGLTQRLKGAASQDEREKLWEDLIPKLRRVARNRIKVAGLGGRERPTELINDVFPGLQRALDNPATRFESRAHFLAYAAQAMRRQLAANAKKMLADELLDDQFAFESASPALAIAVSEALDQLSERLPRAVRAFELREYGGYSYEEILELMSAEYRTKALLAADLTLVRKSLVNILRGAP
jgi:DNA-directed RNA polymerase specialized sigma24 family protein